MNKEKVWVMKFEQERIKTGKNLFGEKFTASTANRLSKSISTNNANQIVVSPLKQVGKVKHPTGRQVRFNLLTWNYTDGDVIIITKTNTTSEGVTCILILLIGYCKARKPDDSDYCCQEEHD